MRSYKFSRKWMKLLLVFPVLMSSIVSYAFTPLVYDPAIGINVVRHGGTTGWVARWDVLSMPGGVIEYWINPRFPPGIPPFASQDQLINTIQKAFQIWEDVPTATIRFRYMGLTDALAAFDGKNVITFFPQRPLPAGFPGGIFPFSWYADQAGPFTLPNGRVITASFPAQFIDSDIVINPRGRFQFSNEYPLPEDTFDFLGVLVHEIGHFLGLDSTGIAQTTMYGFSTFGGGFFKRELTEVETIGVSALYPEEDFFLRKGRIGGAIRGPGNQPIFGAHVVAIDAETGRAVSSTISGLAGLRSDGVPERFSRTSGDYLLIVPPGEYLILVEPFGGLGQGNPFLSGIFGSAVAGALFVNTEFASTLSTVRVQVAAGEQVEGVEITVAPRSAVTPAMGRTASWLWREDLVRWVDPARARPGTTAILSFEKGSNLIESGQLLPGIQARFLGRAIAVTGVAASSDGRAIVVWVSIASDAPPGLYVLEVSSRSGVTYFPGALRVVP